MCGVLGEGSPLDPLNAAFIFWWHSLNPLVPKGPTADHFYPVITHLSPDGSGLYQDESAAIHRAQNLTGLKRTK